MGWKTWPPAAKIILVVTLVMIVVIVGVTVWSIQQERRSLRAELQDRARFMLVTLSAAASDALSSQRTDALSGLAQRFQGIPDVQVIRFYDVEGLVLGSSDDSEVAWIDTFGQSLAGSDGVAFDWQTERLIAGQAVIWDDQAVGAVSVGLSSASLETSLVAMRNRGIGGAMAVAAAGLLLLLLLGARSAGTAPSQTARAAGGGGSRGARSAARKGASELQQRAARGDAVVAAIFEGVLCVNHSQQIIESNPAAQKMFGYSREELGQQKISDLVLRASSTNGPRREMAYYFDRGQGSLFGRMIEAVAVRSDGSEFPVEWAITRVPSTEPPIFVVIIHDITERKQAEQDLRQAKESAEAATNAKSIFLANMSHELRTPLNAIIGYSELLLEDAQETGDTRFLSDLENIRRAGGQLLSVINDVLDFSRIEAGRVEFMVEVFDVAVVLEEVLIISQPLVTKGDNSFVVDYPADIGTMHTDRTKLQQILLNLLSNAAKFTVQGTISLVVAREVIDGSDWLRFRVTDTGIGMSPQQLKYLFNAFTQADPSITGVYGGSGLGLAITRSYCQLMGGNISVESALKEGSTFTVLLPAVVQPVPGRHYVEDLL